MADTEGRVTCRGVELASISVPQPAVVAWGVLRMPGIDKPKPEKAYYTLSDFCVG